MQENAIPLEQNSLATAEYLNQHGLMHGAGTIQIDIAAATYIDPQDRTKGSDKPLCDTNCGPEGGYTCPARRLANLGLTTKGLAPADKLIQAFITSSEGLRLFNQRFVIGGDLDKYCQEFKIPPEIQDGIAFNLLYGKSRANIFGGNAEMHPQALEIARACHENGMIVNLTTTSGILLSNSQKATSFLNGLQEGFVNILAVTGEFKNADEVRKFAAMDSDALKEERKRIPFYLGQKRKGIAAVHAGKLQNTVPNFPQVLFNIVVHRGNIDRIEEILAALTEAFPNAKLNPYPAQSSFDNDPPIFSEQHIPMVQNFITHRLAEQKAQDPHVILRPHYYAMLAAILETYADDPSTATKMLSGYGVWKCYDAPYNIAGAGRVIQVGASPEIRNLEEEPDAGGELNCFWQDRTILENEKVWNMQPTEIANHICSGMQNNSRQTENPCPGCIMPRLTGDLVSQELGLNPILQSPYLKQRRYVAGF